jgi:hypothetical protein
MNRLDVFKVVCDQRVEKHMSWEVIYERGHPSGWTDDLGIAADRNQWVRELLPGWYARKHETLAGSWSSWISVAHDQKLRSWCEDNLSGYWDMPPDGYLYMGSLDDAMLFKIAWM